MDKSLLVICDTEKAYMTSTVRGLVYESLFNENGWKIGYLDIAERPNKYSKIENKSCDEIVDIAKDYALVYLLKVNSYELLLKLRDKTNCKIVFGLVDGIWKPIHKITGWWRLKSILKKCDAVFAENKYLCSYSYKYNKLSIKVPECVDVEKFDKVGAQKESQRKNSITIGWVGSESTVGALKRISIPLENIFSRYSNLELRIVGCDNLNKLPRFKNVRYTCIGSYDEATMINELMQMDIGLFPPPFDIEEYEIRGMLKGFNYMAAAVPVIFQACGESLDLIIDGEYGLLANTDKDWEEKIVQLIESEDLRIKVGMQGNSFVKQNYSKDRVFEIMEAACQTIIMTYGYKDLQNNDTNLITKLRSYLSGWIVVIEKIVNKVRQV